MQGLALHQGTRLVDPEAGDFKRAVLPAHRELTLAVVREEQRIPAPLNRSPTALCLCL